ncbi:MAG: transposase [Hymenobacter sp.]
MVAALAARGTCAVIPPRRKRRHPHPYDPRALRPAPGRGAPFSRLKQFRRVATRYDKLDTQYLAFIHVAATVLWLRDC